MKNPEKVVPRSSESTGPAQVLDGRVPAVPAALRESESYGHWLDFWHWHGSLAGTEGQP